MFVLLIPTDLSTPIHLRSAITGSSRSKKEWDDLELDILYQDTRECDDLNLGSEASRVFAYLAAHAGETCLLKDIALKFFGDGAANQTPVARGLNDIRICFGVEVKKGEQTWSVNLMYNQVCIGELKKKFRNEVVFTPSTLLAIRILKREELYRLSESRHIEQAKTSEPSRLTHPRPWLPLKSTRHFTGHTKELATLEKMLVLGDTTLTQPVALWGLRGVGKTHLALKFCEKHDTNYHTGVFWVRADTEANIVSDLNTWGGLYAKDCLVPQDPRTSAMRFCSWLSAHGNFLLVLDNVDEVAVAAPWVHAVSTSGQVLITSWVKQVGALANLIPVGVLSNVEGAALLKEQLNATIPSIFDWQQAEILAERLGGLPLALDQAGAAMREAGWSIEEYLTLYENQGKQLREARTLSGNPQTERERYNDHDSVEVTFTLAAQVLENRNPLAVELLRLSAFLSPDAIPENIFTEGAKATFSNPVLWKQLVAAAANLALIENNSSAKTFTVHRLVQDVIRDGLGEKVRQYAESTIEALNSVTPDILGTDWWEPNPLQPHWATCTQWVLRLNINTASANCLLNEFALLQRNRGNYDEAELLHRKAIEISLARNDLDIYIDYNNLAGLLKFMGRYDEAEPLYRKALEINLAIHGEKNPRTATRYNNLAELFRETGRYDEAEPLYRKAIEINISDKKYYPKIVENYNNLAKLLAAKTIYNESESLYKKALEINIEINGGKNSIHAICCNNLAELLREAGRYDEAEPLYKKAIEIDTDIYQENHQYTAIDYKNLAKLLATTNRYYEAEPLYRKALKVFLGLTKLDHHKTNKSLMKNTHEVAKEWIECTNVMGYKENIPYSDEIMKEISDLIIESKKFIVMSSGF